MKQLNFCLFFIALFVSCFATQYDDCGSVTGQVSSVEVSGCPDDQDICILKKGKQAEIKINFTSNADSTSLKTKVEGIILDVPIPFPLPEADACKTGVICPVTKGKSYTYDNKLDIKDAYPDLSVTVRFQLIDDKNTDMVCVEISCKIQ